MRQKKIRGHNRRHRQIDNWRLDNLSLDLTDYLLNERDRYYAKIRVHPWSGFSLTNSVTPQPTGKTKQKILNGLLDIYENWKTQLDSYGTIKTKLSKLNWDYRFDEDHYDNTEVGEPEIYASGQDYEDTVKWFDKLLKKPHRTHKFIGPIGEATESYSFKRSDLWLGGQK